MDADASGGSRSAAGGVGLARHRAGMRDAIEVRLVGRSPAMRRLRQRIEGMAPLWIPVLLRGEPGTGRATAAALLHAWGPAARGELVRIDAATFTSERVLRCHARVVSLTRTAAVADGEVRDAADRVVAKALGSFGVRRRST